MNTRMCYLYRDANNYKVHNEVILKGAISAEQISSIIGCLNEGEFFVPSAVGLPEEKFSEEKMSDHPWFTLEEDDFEATDEEPTVNLTTEKLLGNFLRMNEKWENYILENGV